ncbi:hypothetical protein E3U25_00915 (plasmid) [Paracoccus versutus]|nr:hypothetical protein E3U25_00915 [Paracoccus versutus]
MTPLGAKWAEVKGTTGVLVQYADIGQALAIDTVDSFFVASAAVVDQKAWKALNSFYPVCLMRSKGRRVVNQQACDALPDHLDVRVHRRSDETRKRDARAQGLGTLRDNPALGHRAAGGCPVRAGECVFLPRCYDPYVKQSFIYDDSVSST